MVATRQSDTELAQADLWLFRMKTAWAVVKGAVWVVVGVFVAWLALMFGWIPYASDTPRGRRNTKLYFGLVFLALAGVFAIEGEWELAGFMAGAAVLFTAVLLLVDLWIANTDASERTRENRRRAAMRRRIAEEKAAAARRPGRLP